MIPRARRFSCLFAVAIIMPLLEAPGIAGDVGHRRGSGTASVAKTCPCFHLLYSFGKSPDSVHPETPLLYWNGLLYGTAYEGGLKDLGTVFSFTPSGVETILHSFVGNGDGEIPSAGLTPVNGVFYGTTLDGGGSHGGGSHGGGAVFKIDSTGSEHIVHDFGADVDGSEPNGLIDVDGVLYGTTRVGGTNGQGTVFSVTPDHAETVLHSFGGPGDGTLPYSTLVYFDGELYGTTGYGGTKGFGTIFKMARDGTEKVVHAFAGGRDGGNNFGALVALNGTLYGTTSEGGAFGGGTVFSLDAAGVKTTVYDFGKPAGPGYQPDASLIAANGVLFGATVGGYFDRYRYTFPATIFSITPSGTVTNLYAFPSGGHAGQISLTAANGVIYGTTAYGGRDNGTLFSLEL